MYGPGKVTSTLGGSAGASLPVLGGFNVIAYVVFAATLALACVALLTIVPRVRRSRARNR